MTGHAGHNHPRLSQNLRDTLTGLAIFLLTPFTDPAAKVFIPRWYYGRHAVGIIKGIIIALLTMIGYSIVTFFGMALEVVGWVDDGFTQAAHDSWWWLLMFLWLIYLPVCIGFSIAIVVRHLRRTPGQPMWDDHIPGGYIGFTWLTYLVPVWIDDNTDFCREEVAKRLLEPVYLMLISTLLEGVGVPIGFCWYVTIAAWCIGFRNNLIFMREREWARGIADQEAFSERLMGGMVFADKTAKTSRNMNGMARLNTNRPQQNAGGFAAIRTRLDPVFLSWLGELPQPERPDQPESPQDTEPPTESVSEKSAQTSNDVAEAQSEPLEIHCAACDRELTVPVIHRGKRAKCACGLPISLLPIDCCCPNCGTVQHYVEAQIGWFDECRLCGTEIEIQNPMEVRSDGIPANL